MSEEKEEEFTNIIIDTDDIYENIIVTVIDDINDPDQNVVMTLSLQEAQLLSIMLGEAVTTALLQKMQLFPDPSDKLH